MSELLSLHQVRAGYGESVVLENIDLSMQQGESLALLGRNGVGKTTLLLTLMGLTQLHGGEIRFAGKPLTGMPSFRRAQSGLGWVPQERGMFPSLTVEEHLSAVARPGPWNLQRVYDIFPRLHERRANHGNLLSGGEQQMVAIARALMTNPRLLLLDEPTEGLAPIIVQELMRVLQALIRDEGLSVIVVEQHARLALSLAQRAIVLDRGKIIVDLESTALLNDQEQLNRLLTVS
ncbi:MAG TPA: ABC transporter ATP-binding protein [Burkholderiaceae bacterium]|jgi:branched-chain amino acid transport system ATP-binding protein